MSTLPQIESESKKTIGQIAREATNPKATGDPSKPFQKKSSGARINDRWNHELEKFLGKQVVVMTHDDGVIEGECLALSYTGGIPIVQTETSKIIVRNWKQIRRTVGGKPA